jgi:hypothetical protein
MNGTRLHMNQLQLKFGSYCQVAEDVTVGVYIYLRLDTETCFRVGHGFPCRDLDSYVSTYEKWTQVEAVSSNQIFVWAMIFPCFYTQ